MRHDVVVVGAGSAGIPLAARLSEDPDRSVLLLEAGPTDMESFADARDGTTLHAAVAGHPLTATYPTALTPTRPYSITRGRALGGSSAINGGAFVRARPEDFTQWASHDAPAWAYEHVLPLWRSLETDMDYGETAVHGGSGPMVVSRAPQDSQVAQAFATAAAAMGFPVEHDKNAAGPPGVGALPRTVVDGVRRSTAMQYLPPGHRRPNLTIRGHSRAVRVLVRHGRVTGVEVASSEGRHVVAAGEVVLAAGAIASPHLLLLSGIGPAQELAAAGVPVVVDAPGVGQGFSDHPQLAVEWHSPPTAGGPPAEAFVTALELISPGGPAHGDVQILLAAQPLTALLGETGSISGGTFLIGILAPESRGRMRLQSADPGAAPQIEHRYLTAPTDQRRLRYGLRLARTLLDSAPFAGIVEQLSTDIRADDDDDTLDRWIADHLGTALHMSGSARLGRSDDPLAVVDQYGRVRGVSGLRVADTSIVPTVPSRGPAATAVLIGELVAHFMRRGD